MYENNPQLLAKILLQTRRSTWHMSHKETRAFSLARVYLLWTRKHGARGKRDKSRLLAKPIFQTNKMIDRIIFNDLSASVYSLLPSKKQSRTTNEESRRKPRSFRCKSVVFFSSPRRSPGLEVRSPVAIERRCCSCRFQKF